MDVQVIDDIPDTPDTRAPRCAADRPEDGPAIRRFVLEPATSPALLAALAWASAGPRR